MRSSRFRIRSSEWLERLTVNAVVATVLGSIAASSDTVECEGRQIEAVLNIVHKKKFYSQHFRTVELRVMLLNLIFVILRGEYAVPR